MANICISDLKSCDSCDSTEVLSEQDRLSIHGGAVTSGFYFGADGSVGAGIGVSIGGSSFGVGVGFAAGGGGAALKFSFV
jgi:hypothetical protein